MLKTFFSSSLPKDGASKTARVAGRFVAAIVASTIFVSPALAAKYAGIVVDAKTGKVLYNDDADSLRYPASLTKMMTLYLAFEALEAGKISLSDKVPVSAHAASEPPSKLGVRPGGSITVEQVILSLVTRSANDMSTAMGEFLGGSEARFAQMMTNKARALGMTRTTYRNAHGLPNTAQMTTARDQARLGIALRQHFPQYYGYFNTRSFRFGKQVIGNHNRLVGNVKGVDGIKTGYTRAAGSNLATSAQLDGRSIVAVILGAKGSAARDAQMRKLVATYLPQASRGGNSNLIAQTAPAPSLPVRDVPKPSAPSVDVRQLASMDLPNAGPTPEVRYEQKVPGASAYAAEPKSRGARDAVSSVIANNAPVPPRGLAPAAGYLREPTGEQQVATVTDSVTTASTRSDRQAATAQEIAGWVVQIGVSPNRDMAMDLLSSAQDKGGSALRGAKPFTVAVNSNGSQLYRARFGGFDDQKKAVNACNALKKKGIKCWASLQ